MVSFWALQSVVTVKRIMAFSEEIDSQEHPLQSWECFHLDLSLKRATWPSQNSFNLICDIFFFKYKTFPTWVIVLCVHLNQTECELFVIFPPKQICFVRTETWLETSVRPSSRQYCARFACNHSNQIFQVQCVQLCSFVLIKLSCLQH